MEQSSIFIPDSQTANASGFYTTALSTWNSLSVRRIQRGCSHTVCIQSVLWGKKAIGSKGHQMLPLNGNGAKNCHALEGKSMKGRVRKWKNHEIQEEGVKGGERGEGSITEGHIIADKTR